MSAASLLTLVGSVIVTGAGRRLAVEPDRRPPLDDSAMVGTVPAADGIWLAAERGGCQATQASTRMPVRPSPALATSTSSSLVTRTPSGPSTKPRSQAGGPKSASPRVNRPGRCACSQASSACGLPGASQKAVTCTSQLATRKLIGHLSTPPVRFGGPARRRPPGGTAKDVRMAAAAAWARCLGVWLGATVVSSVDAEADPPEEADRGPSRPRLPGRAGRQGEGHGGGREGAPSAPIR